VRERKGREGGGREEKKEGWRKIESTSGFEIKRER
jgi:hypothetical protein